MTIKISPVFAPSDPYPGRVAILDLGTNTFILTIADDVLEVKGFHVLLDEAIVCRLGEGIHQSPYFLPLAMNRALEVLKKFSHQAMDYGCEKIIAVGTAAFRHANNSGEFCQRVEDECGFKIRVISGEEEAHFIKKAVLQDFSDSPKPLLILDIGGGSTEFIFIGNNGEILLEKSLPFGTVRFYEKFIHSDPPQKSEIENLENAILEQLETLDVEMNVGTIVATAGSATNASALIQNLVAYDPVQVHGSKITTYQLKNLSDSLEAQTFSQRSARACLEPRRADVVVVGTRILRAVADFFNMENILVSDRGLRYGVLAGLRE